MRTSSLLNSIALVVAIVAPTSTSPNGATPVPLAPQVPQSELVDLIAIRVGDFVFDGLVAGPEDGDPVILLHGFPETSYAFRHQLEALARAGYRAIAPDQRGYSADARPSEVADYAMGFLVSDVAGIADALGFDSFHLVGHDWGGAVAWVFAATFPERVRTLTVLSTPHPGAFGAALSSSPDQQQRSAYFDMFRADDAEERFLANNAAYLRQVLDEVADAEAIRVYVTALRSPEAMGSALNWYRAMSLSANSASTTVTSTVPLQITVPTLYVWGTDDPAFGLAAARASARYVTGPYEFVPMERTGHWLMERRPTRVNELLLRHLGGHTSPYELSFRAIRPGIWVAYRRDPYRSPVHGNVTIIVNDDDVVVVDSGSAPAAARQVIDKIRSLTDAPVTTVINTHGHEDHVLGNQVFAQEFPDVQIIAREGTREYLTNGTVAGRVRGFAAGMQEQREEGATEMARVQARGLNGDNEIVDYLRRYYERDMDAVKNAYAEVRVTPPTSTFRDRLVLQRSGRSIELLDLGFGKAGSDLVVYLPEEKLVIAGDIVTHPVPLGFARLQTQWLQTLRRLVEIDFRNVVPGHGDVLVDKAYVRLVIELVEFEIAAVRSAIRQGQDAEAAAWEITFANWDERFVDNDTIGRYFFDTWFVQPAVSRAYAELGGQRP